MGGVLAYRIPRDPKIRGIRQGVKDLIDQPSFVAAQKGYGFSDEVTRENACWFLMLESRTCKAKLVRNVAKGRDCPRSVRNCHARTARPKGLFN